MFFSHARFVFFKKLLMLNVLQKDVDFQTDIYTIQGHWKGFSDSHSSIHYYRAGLGTAKYESNIRGMVDVGLVNGEWMLCYNTLIFNTSY